MNVGDYVRTEKGLIGKYNIIKTGETIPNWNGGYDYKEIEKEYIDNIIYNRFDDKIIKSSPNIIDLLEKGDLVVDYTGDVYKVYYIYDDYVFTTFIGEDGITKTLTDYQIKSIVTKEQFESMEYKVGE